MAQEQQAVEPAGVYEQFVVVAENTWKLYAETYKITHRTGPGQIPCEQISTTKFDMNFGGFEWECAFRWKRELTLLCNNNADENIQFELNIFDDKFLKPYDYDAYGEVNIVPTRFSSFYSKNIRFLDNEWKYLVLNIRMLKRRSALPDFTSEYVKIGLLKSNHTLKVGGQTFHVNKELLSMYSRFFDRMFNGDFAEAKKAETDLASESADPKLFHDFLAFMVCPGGCKMLPNRTNVVGIMQLARFYQVDFLMETCERFLENSYEMPVWERLMAAKGNKELKTRIANKLRTMDAWKELALKLIDESDD